MAHCISLLILACVSGCAYVGCCKLSMCAVPAQPAHPTHPAQRPYLEEVGRSILSETVRRLRLQAFRGWLCAGRPWATNKTH